MTTYPLSRECMILSHAPILKELILDGMHNEHILPYLSLKADQLEKLEISNQWSDVLMRCTSTPYISIFPSLRYI
jgi:hypothetical protein